MAAAESTARMSMPSSIRRAVLLYLLVWLILGIVFAALVALAGARTWQAALLFAVPVTLLYAVASGFSAYHLCRAFPLTERSPLAILAVFLVSALVAGAMWSVLCAIWNDVLGTVGNAAGMTMSNAVQGMIFGVGVLLYGLSAVANYLAIEFGRARSAERRELEAALMARTAELRLLRAQLDPHFLFNSLNSISALTSIDPARARTMTLSLADFFRHSLALHAGAKVPLHAEVALAMRFLSIEQVRFGARLRVVTDIEPAAEVCLVPPMLLQPLIENAVKHGIAQLTEGGVVHLSARRAGSQLFIKVVNDVDGDVDVDVDVNVNQDARAADTMGKAPHEQTARAGGDAVGIAADVSVRTGGMGLANVRLRLAADFAHEALVHWGRRDGRFEVELMLPVQMTESAPGQMESVCVS